MIACTSASAKRQGGGSHRNGARQGRRQAQLPQPLAAWLQRGPRMAGKLGKSKGGRHAKRPALSLPIDIGVNAITPVAGWPPRRGAGRPVARTSALMTPCVAGEDRGNRPGRGAPLHSRSHDATRAHTGNKGTPRRAAGAEPPCSRRIRKGCSPLLTKTGGKEATGTGL
jgi:hypothetical protein